MRSCTPGKCTDAGWCSSRSRHSTRPIRANPTEVFSADVVYVPGDLGAAISSGSYRPMGMVVAPCSIRTPGEIAAAWQSRSL